MEGLIQIETESSDNSPRPGPKSTHDDVRSRLVEAALRILLEDGIAASLKGVSFSDVVDRSGVPRATAYRALSGNSEALDHGTARQVTDVMREAIRVSCEDNYNTLQGSIFWRACIAMEGSVASQGDSAEPEILAEFEERERNSIDDFAELYDAMGAVFGLGIKAPYSWRQIAAASASLVEGIAIRARISDEVGPTMRRTGPGGKEVEWTLLGIGFEALICAMTEPIPGRIAADLTLPDFEETPR